MKKVKLVLGSNEKQFVLNLEDVVAETVFNRALYAMIDDGKVSPCNCGACKEETIKENLGGDISGDSFESRFKDLDIDSAPQISDTGNCAIANDIIAQEKIITDNAGEGEKSDEFKTMSDLMPLVEESLSSMNKSGKTYVAPKKDDEFITLKEGRKYTALLRCDKCSSKFFASITKDGEAKCQCGNIIKCDTEYLKGQYTCQKCYNVADFVASKGIDAYNGKCYNCKSEIKLKFDSIRNQVNNY